MCEVEGVNVKVHSERSAMQVRKKVVRWGLLCRTKACCNARGERPASPSAFGRCPKDSRQCVEMPLAGECDWGGSERDPGRGRRGI